MLGNSAVVWDDDPELVKKIILGANAPDYDGRIEHTRVHLFAGASDAREVERFGRLVWSETDGPDSASIRLLARSWLDMWHIRESRYGQMIRDFLISRPAHLNEMADELAAADSGIRAALVKMWNHVAESSGGYAIEECDHIDTIGREILAKAGKLPKKFAHGTMGAAQPAAPTI